MSNANPKRYVFSLYLKTLVSEIVRSSAGREFHDAGPEKEKARSPNFGAQSRCGVAVCLRERAQAGARHSGGSRLHDVGQITRRLSDVDVVHESAKLVGDSVTNW